VIKVGQIRLTESFVNTSAFTYLVRLPTTGLLDRNKFR